MLFAKRQFKIKPELGCYSLCRGLPFYTTFQLGWKASSSALQNEMSKGSCQVPRIMVLSWFQEQFIHLGEVRIYYWDIGL